MFLILIKAALILVAVVFIVLAMIMAWGWIQTILLDRYRERKLAQRPIPPDEFARMSRDWEKQYLTSFERQLQLAEEQQLDRELGTIFPETPEEVLRERTRFKRQEWLAGRALSPYITGADDRLYAQEEGTRSRVADPPPHPQDPEPPAGYQDYLHRQ